MSEDKDESKKEPHSSEEAYRRLEPLLRQIEKQRRERGMGLHQQFTIAVGTVGAIAFAALVLAIQDPKPFEVPSAPNALIQVTGQQWWHLLITALGVVCVFSVFSVLATSFVGADLVHFDSLLGWFGYGAGIVTMSGFLSAVALIVNDETNLGSIILGVVTVVLFVIFGILCIVA